MLSLALRQMLPSQAGQVASTDNVLQTYSQKTRVQKYISICIILVELVRALPETELLEAVLKQRYSIAQDCCYKAI